MRELRERLRTSGEPELTIPAGFERAVNEKTGELDSKISGLKRNLKALIPISDEEQLELKLGMATCILKALGDYKPTREARAILKLQLEKGDSIADALDILYGICHEPKLFTDEALIGSRSIRNDCDWRKDEDIFSPTRYRHSFGNNSVEKFIRFVDESILNSIRIFRNIIGFPRTLVGVDKRRDTIEFDDNGNNFFNFIQENVKNPLKKSINLFSQAISYSDGGCVGATVTMFVILPIATACFGFWGPTAAIGFLKTVLGIWGASFIATIPTYLDYQKKRAEFIQPNYTPSGKEMAWVAAKIVLASISKEKGNKGIKRAQAEMNPGVIGEIDKEIKAGNIREADAESAYLGAASHFAGRLLEAKGPGESGEEFFSKQEKITGKINQAEEERAVLSQSKQKVKNLFNPILVEVIRDVSQKENVRALRHNLNLGEDQNRIELINVAEISEERIFSSLEEFIKRFGHDDTRAKLEENVKNSDAFKALVPIEQMLFMKYLETLLEDVKGASEELAHLSVPSLTLTKDGGAKHQQNAA